MVKPRTYFAVILVIIWPWNTPIWNRINKLLYSMSNFYGHYLMLKMANTHSGLSTLYVNMPCLFRYLQFLYQTCILHHFMLLFHVLDKKWIIDLFIPSAILNSKLTPIMFYKLRQMKFMFQILLIFHNPRYRPILYSQSKNWKLHCIQSNLQHLLVKRNTP